MYHHHHLNHSFNRQRGVVIVMALFFVALVAALSYYMTSRLDRDIRRTELLLNNAQAELYARGSIAWAVMQLRDNLSKQQPNKLVDITPIKSPVNTVNGYKIQSTIYDMQSRFNVNNLVRPTDQGDFKRLLQTVVKDLPDPQANSILKGVVDWVSIPQSNEFLEYYAKLTPPYSSAHRLMGGASELRLIKGITPSIYRALSPYVVALPTQTEVNVQTAPAPVLMTLSPTLTLGEAQAVEALRKETPFITPQTFLNLDIIKKAQILADKITVNSTYFLVETTVTKQDQTLLVYTLIERTADQGKPIIAILWESKGVW